MAIREVTEEESNARNGFLILGGESWLQTGQTHDISAKSPDKFETTPAPPFHLHDRGSIFFQAIPFSMADQLESLISPKNSDSGLHIQLHPLILLTISDHITRHAARCQQGPIIGALLGQQNGREITLEHAFECVVREDSNGEIQIPQDWFVERVKQCKSPPPYLNHLDVSRTR